MYGNRTSCEGGEAKRSRVMKTMMMMMMLMMMTMRKETA